MNRKGFALIIFLAVIVVLIVVGLLIYLHFEKSTVSPSPTSVAKTLQATSSTQFSAVINKTGSEIDIMRGDDLVNKILASALPTGVGVSMGIYDGPPLPAIFSNAWIDPSGSHVVFLVYYDGAQNTLYTFGMSDINGQNAHLFDVTTYGSGIDSVSFSPDGKYLAYVENWENSACSAGSLPDVLDVVQGKDLDPDGTLINGSSDGSDVENLSWASDNKLTFSLDRWNCPDPNWPQNISSQNYQWFLNTNTIKISSSQ